MGVEVFGGAWWWLCKVICVMCIKPNYSKDLLEVLLRLGSVLTPKVKLVLTKLMIIALIMLEPFQYVAFHRFCIFTTKNYT